MKKICFFGEVILAVFLFIICLNSCTEDCNCPVAPVEPEADYHLIYGPAPGGTFLPYHYLTYSTQTGQIIDTLLSEFAYRDFWFTKDGNKMIYMGTHVVPPNDLFCEVGVIDNVTGDTISILEEGLGTGLNFDFDENHLITYGYGVTILSFPDLNMIYRDSAAYADGAGFLTSPGKAYYFNDESDSIFVVDFNNPDSVIISHVSVLLSSTTARPTAAAVDTKNRKLILVSSGWTDDSRFSYVTVFDSDSMGFFIQRLYIPRGYKEIAISPYTAQIYLYGSFAYETENNRIDIYDLELNVAYPFIEQKDVFSRTPFWPLEIEFTPDGKMVYALIGGPPWGPSAVMGINLDSKSIEQYLKPQYANGDLIAIEPINHAK